MPVGLLLCEGNANSPDARVLNRIIAGRGMIQPMGGKYGMGDRIKARREAMRQATVYGLLDGDFTADWKTPTNCPKDWIVDSGKTFLGWRWERKEIENYLIDPKVVRYALAQNAPNIVAYQAALERARDRVPTYQAARLALSIHRPRFRPMANALGRERGELKHLMPDDFGVPSCMEGIRQTISGYNEQQTVGLAVVEAEFQKRRAECEAGGIRYSSFLTAFAGKDLLYAMSNDLQAFGFSSPATFLEKVLQGVDNTANDVTLWLDEWTALRQAVDAI